MIKWNKFNKYFKPKPKFEHITTNFYTPLTSQVEELATPPNFYTPLTTLYTPLTGQVEEPEKPLERINAISAHNVGQPLRTPTPPHLPVRTVRQAATREQAALFHIAPGPCG